MENTKNAALTGPVKIEDQPLSDFKYIAGKYGFNTVEEMAVHCKVDRDELEAMITAGGERRSKNCTGYIKKLRKKQYDKQRTYKGRLYTNKELIELTGLPKSTIEKRIQHGWNVEKILQEAKQQNGEYDLTIDGVTYPTIKEAALAYGQNPVTVESRLRNGKTAAEAVLAVKPRKGGNGRNQGVFAFGEWFTSLKALCNSKGLNYASFMSLKRSHPEMSVETLAIRQLFTPAYKYAVYGKGYETLKQISDVFDVDYYFLTSRMQDRTYATIEDIIEDWHRSDGRRLEKKEKKEKVFKHTVLGVGYTTITGACRANGVKPEFVYQKTKGGMTVEEAIKYALEKGIGLTA